MAKYRRKPKEIEAFKYDGDFINSSGEYYVPEWAVEALKNGILYYDSHNENEPPSTLFLDGLVLDIKVGYYIIRQSDGVISACTESYLNEQYEIIE